jgi:signal transduction histidine kinase
MTVVHSCVIVGGPLAVGIYFLAGRHDPEAALLALCAAVVGAWTRVATQSSQRRLARAMAAHELVAVDLAARRLYDARLKIAADLHDGLGADLSRLQDGTTRLAESTCGELKSEFTSLGRRIGESIDELRSCVWGFEKARPWCELVLHLRGRLQALALDKIDLDFVDGAPPTASDDVPGERCLALLRILEESLRNAISHGGATAVKVRLAVVGATIQATVDDDGSGITSGEITASRGGLSHMRARAALLGGRVEILPQERGVRVDIALPLLEAA